MLKVLKSGRTSMLILPNLLERLLDDYLLSVHDIHTFLQCLHAAALQVVTRNILQLRKVDFLDGIGLVVIIGERAELTGAHAGSYGQVYTSLTEFSTCPLVESYTLSLVG